MSDLTAEEQKAEQLKRFGVERAALDAHYAKIRYDLEACFYGTPVEREADSGVTRPKRSEDGWRHGKSHPFRIGDKTYDVQADILDDVDGKVLRHGTDRSKGLFDSLCSVIELHREVAVLTLNEGFERPLGDLDRVEDLVPQPPRPGDDPAEVRVKKVVRSKTKMLQDEIEKFRARGIDIS
jgi:hypothetical protein